MGKVREMVEGYFEKGKGGDTEGLDGDGTRKGIQSQENFHSWTAY